MVNTTSKTTVATKAKGKSSTQKKPTGVAKTRGKTTAATTGAAKKKSTRGAAAAASSRQPRSNANSRKKRSNSAQARADMSDDEDAASAADADEEETDAEDDDEVDPYKQKLVTEIAAIFNDAQEASKKHKCITQLTKLQKRVAKERSKQQADDQEMEEDVFLECLLLALRPALLVEKTTPNMDRFINFFIDFCLQQTAEHTKKVRERQMAAANAQTGASAAAAAANAQPEEELVETYDHESVLFTTRVISSLVDLSDASDKNVRFHVVKIVALLMQKLPDDAEVDVDYFDKITEIMSNRLNDKMPNIRMWALVALKRLPDIENSEDPITQAMLRLMQQDSSNHVRKAATECVLSSKKTIPFIIGRSRDVKEDVRLAAFHKVQESIPLNKLSIEQRVTLLKNGLSDRDSSVREKCIQMLIFTWLPQVNNNVLELLRKLDVEEHQAICEQVLEVLFQRAWERKHGSSGDSQNSKKGNGLSLERAEQILDIKASLEDLTPELALYWRCRSDFLKDHDGVALDDQLPDSLELFEALMKLTSGDQSCQVTLMLPIVKYLDLLDGDRRNKILAMLSTLLLTFRFPEMHVKELVSAIKSILVVSSNEHGEFQDFLVARIENLRAAALKAEQSVSKQLEDLEGEEASILAHIQRVKADSAKLMEDLKRTKKKQERDEIHAKEEALQKRLNNLQQELAEVVRILENAMTMDIMLWARALLVTSELLEQGSMVIDVNQILYLVKDLVIALLQPGENPTVEQERVQGNKYLQAIAYRVLGQFCCLSEDQALANLPAFLRYLAIDEENSNQDVLATVLRSVFDMFQLHGLDRCFNGPSTFDLDLTQPAAPAQRVVSELERMAIVALKNLTVSTHQEIRTLVVEGFAKLIMCNKLEQRLLPDILSRMVMMLFSKNTEKDDRLRQCLAVFLPSFSYSLSNNIKTIASIVVPTLRRIAHAPKELGYSDLATPAKLTQVAMYLVSLCDPDKLHPAQKELCDISKLLAHEKICLDICFEILSELAGDTKNNPFVPVYCKLFSQFTIYTNNLAEIRQIRHLLPEIEESVKNKLAKNQVEKFRNVLAQAWEDGIAELKASLEQQQQQQGQNAAQEAAVEPSEGLTEEETEDLEQRLMKHIDRRTEFIASLNADGPSDGDSLDLAQFYEQDPLPPLGLLSPVASPRVDSRRVSAPPSSNRRKSTHDFMKLEKDRRRSRDSLGSVSDILGDDGFDDDDSEDEMIVRTLGAGAAGDEESIDQLIDDLDVDDGAATSRTKQEDADYLDEEE